MKRKKIRRFERGWKNKLDLKSIQKYKWKKKFYLIEFIKNMKGKKSLTQKQYVECYTKALTYFAQILVGAFFIAALIFPIF